MAVDTRKTRTLIFTAATLAGILVLATATFFWITQERLNERKREQVADIVTFSDLPSGASVEATIDMNGRTETVTFAGDRLVLSPEQQAEFHLPYILRATVREAVGAYRDFYWSVGKTGAEYYIGASGFDPKDRAILVINDQPSQNVPFDWSGRIEFPIFLIIEEDQKSCIYTETVDGNKLGTCHYTAGQKAAS